MDIVSPISVSQRAVQALTYFSIGGLSGAIATSVIQPIDTLKVQIQVFSERMGKSKRLSFLNIFRTIRQEKGLSVFYSGLDSAILRQIFYASARLGSYNFIIQSLKSDGRTIGKVDKVGIAMLSGMLGALVGNPFDVALIRKQASISEANGKPYNNTLDAFSRIIKEEGARSLWTGIDITILRVILINIGQLASRDIISEEISQRTSIPKFYKDNLAAVLASVLTSFISLPADNIKVKIQKQNKQKPLYSGIGDCFVKTIQRQGFTRLWVGFWVYLVRGFPHGFILIRVQQYLTEAYQKSQK